MARGLTDRDDGATHFDEFLKRDRRVTSGPEGIDKRLHEGLLSLVLAPQTQCLEARPAVSAQLAEIVEMQNPSGAEHLYRLLREGTVAIRHIVYSSHRAIGELQRDGGAVALV